MPLNLFYTMVQKSQKWPKTQIKGGSCLNSGKWPDSGQCFEPWKISTFSNWVKVRHPKRLQARPPEGRKWRKARQTDRIWENATIKGEVRRKMNFTNVFGFVALRDVVKVFPVSSSSFARQTTVRNRARSHSGAWRGLKTKRDLKLSLPSPTYLIRYFLSKSERQLPSSSSTLSSSDSSSAWLSSHFLDPSENRCECVAPGRRQPRETSWTSDGRLSYPLINLHAPSSFTYVSVIYSANFPFQKKKETTVVWLKTWSDKLSQTLCPSREAQLRTMHHSLSRLPQCCTETGIHWRNSWREKKQIVKRITSVAC